jgi:cell division septal protein FtsQ
MPKPPEPKKPRINWRMALRLSIWAAVFGSVAYAGMQVRSFMLSDAHFTFECADGCKGVEVLGAVYSSPARIHAVFAQDTGKSVFDIPLDERRRHLLAIDWVRDATVARVWPDKIRVTIQERAPIAFASMPIAHTPRHWLALIDDQGVLLSIPPRKRFVLPVLSGITEDQTEGARQKRVDAMRHLLSDLGPQSKEISEINASTLEDMRVITTVDGNPVELWLGDQHYRSRYLNFVNHYRQIHGDSPRASIFDLRLDDRILVR